MPGVCDPLRGHWGGQGAMPCCACPTPPQSPQAKLTPVQFDRFEALGVLFVARMLSGCELDEYQDLWTLCYPHLATHTRWRKAA